MSEDNQENGTANGDVPEIELIIKDENSINIDDVHDSEPEYEALQTVQLSRDDTTKTCDQYIIYEVQVDAEPFINYVFTEIKKPPDDGDPHLPTTPSAVKSKFQEVQLNSPAAAPYLISVQIPIEEDQEESKENAPKSGRTTAASRKQLAEAVTAVVNKEMSISKAAIAFEVTKSTLWKEVNKHTNHRRKKDKTELNKKITDRICAGESLSVISRSLNVAKSTLHQHKVRLAQSGRLPSSVHLKPPTDPSVKLAQKERIIQAFRGCRVNGMSIRFAAKLYSVPPSTLWTHIKRFKASQQKSAEAFKKETGHVNDDDYDDDDEDDDDEDDDDEDDDDEDEEEDIISPMEQMEMEQFDMDEYYKRQEATSISEDGDLLISFDFESFEEYIKRELE